MVTLACELIGRDVHSKLPGFLNTIAVVMTLPLDIGLQLTDGVRARKVTYSESFGVRDWAGTFGELLGTRQA